MACLILTFVVLTVTGALYSEEKLYYPRIKMPTSEILDGSFIANGAVCLATPDPQVGTE